jgi:hypothetical protein
LFALVPSFRDTGLDKAGGAAMGLTGTFTGLGKLKVDGEEVGTVEYEIDEYFDGYFKSAEGWIDGDVGVLAEAFESRNVALVRSDNDFEMKILITRFSPGNPAGITVSGPTRPT